MLKFSQTTADQIRFLLHSVNHSNSDYVLQYLTQFIEYGIEGSTLLLQTCLDYLNQYRIDVKNVALEHVLASVFKYLIDQPNFSTMFCESLRTTEVNEGTLENFSSALQLSVPEKIGIGLALSDSENLETRIVGKNFCMVQIEQLRESSVDNISSEKIQNIILFLQRSEDLFKHLDSFMQMLSLLQLKDDESSFVLSPLLSDELRDTNFLRNVDFFRETGENDFDVILAEMEKEMSMGDIMKELGYGCTVDSSQCKEILSLFLPLNEIAVSKILGSVACTHAGLGDNQSTFSTFRKALGYSISFDLPIQNTWNVDVLVDSINQLAPDTNWISVIERLDHEGFYIPNQEAFSFFMSVYKHACQEPFPLHAICGSVWKNADGQLSFLRQAVSLPPEVFTFAHSVRQLPYTDGASGRKLQLGHANHAWLCLDLLDVLCRLAERGHALSVRSILEYPLQHCPEILLLGMAHINTPYSLLQYEVSVIVFPLIVKNPMGNDMIVHLWQTNPSLVLRGFVDTYNDNPGIMTRILDICRELKILSSVMEMIPSPFSIRLAALAFRKDLVELEKWLSSNLITYKDTFFEECLKFLKEIQASGTQDFSTTPFQHSDAVSTLYGDTTTTFSKVLKAYVGQITSSHLTEEIEKLSVLFMDPNPRVANGGSTESSTDGYADDIEAEANTYFRQMFSGELTVESMVQRLAHFKESSVQREQSIFECMIANLFEEYKFFPKYPDRQLIIAAILFGSVIKQQLVTHLTLGIALRGVLDALRKPADSRMFVFGTKALEQFVERLMEWPQYCNHILQISHLRSTHSELVLFIEKTLARISSGHLDLDHGPSHVASGNMESNGTGIIQTGRIPSSSFQLQHESSFDDRLKASNSLNEVKPLPPAATQTAAPVGDASNNQKLQTAVSAPSMLNSVSPGFVRPLRGPPSTRFGSALSIETLVAAAEKRDAPVEAPAEIQDKVLFIINNISITNIEVKSKEMSEILKEQYYPWFAQYMVMKRASIEPNFHDLYLKFLDKLNSKALNKEIVQATYENCKVLLGSELIKSSSEERSLLKNLGSWLGKLTIGRNQVLRACEIDPKSLIIEAYEKGLMIAVIPFTSKILEPCQSSLAYQPPNPWTMAILGLLAEIYSMPNLKMNLKFDIEVLFKNLGVDLKEIKPTSLLKDHTRELEGNPDFSNKDVGVPQPQIPEVQSGINSPLNQVELPLEVAPSNSGSHSHLLSQYLTLMEDDKLGFGLSDQITSAQGLIKASPSQSTFSASQHPTATPNIGTHVIINPKLNAGGLHVHFQRVVPHAMDRAIKEIVSGIVQRSVSIATQTTKELVLKDYAMESDDTRIYNAAHLMVASLAGSLAHVTCKEPLRTSILSQLRNSLQGLNITNEYLEQAVLLVTNDNLDLGCAVIEQAATNEAVATIDGEIGPQLSLRRKREGVGATYFDANMYPQGSTGVVPEALRPKPGHLSLSHRVYEDFVRLPLQNQTIQSSHALPVATTASSSSAGLPSTYGSASGQLNTGYSPGPGRKFEAVSRPLDGVMETNSALHLSASSIHVGVGDGVSKHTSENDSVVASFPSTASVPEPHPVDPSDAVKEYGVSSQPPSSPAATERVGNLSELSLSTGVAMERYQIVAQKLETLVTNDARESEIQGVIGEVTDIILRCISRDEAALAVAQKVFKSLYENASNRVHVSAHIAMLTAICDVCKLVFTQLTSWVIYSDEERKFNTEISVGLIHSDLLNLAEYNIHIANLVDGGRNKRATEFATSLVRTLSNEAYEYISELKNVIEALTKVAAKPGSPESLQQLIEIIKNRSANVAALSDVNDVKDDKATVHSPGSREEFCIVESAEPDPPGFRDQVKDVFAQWCCVSDHPAYENNCAHLVMNLRSLGFLMDDVVDRFFRVLTELSVEHCVSSEVINSGTQSAPQQTQNISFLAIDIYAKIVTSVFKMEQGSNKLNLLSKVLAVTVRLIQKDAEEKKSSFNARPYFRLFVNWLLDLGALDPALDAFQGLTAFANAFHALQPLKVPAFSFAWLELVSNRRFMPKMLAGNGQKGWPYIQRLLVDLFQFMEPFLRNAELGVPVHTLYKGTLRVLLVLLHDFPEFLCDYHFTFCDVIPSSCIQMRNIILSAFPRNMRLPDPSTPNLKIDLLAEINQSPRVLSEVDLALKVKQMKTNVDEYLKLRQPGSSFLTELKQKLLLSSTEAASAGTRYNVPLINSLVLYVGMQAIQQLQARTPHSQANQTGPFVFLVGAALDIFQTLTMDLDTEGRYLFLNAIANQLRYPNTHTHYFSFIILYLFAESNQQEIIQEQITRVLLERLIANRPHPWGLLITFIELIKNPRYNFWNRSFIRCAPEIEKLFESVSRSCGAKPADESLVSGWVPETAH